MGITDYIEKPINQNHLFSKILAMKEPHFSGVYQSLMDNYCNNDETLLVRLLKDFIEELNKSRDALEAASQEGLSGQEAEEFAKELRHKLKAAVSMFGQLDKVEAIYKDQANPVDGLKRAVDELLKFTDEFRRAQL